MDSYQVGRASRKGYIQLWEGAARKTLVYGEKTLLTEFRFAKGSSLPKHKHPHEQTGYLVTGLLVLIIDGEPYTMNPGDSWCIKGNIEHSAEIMEESVAIEVFSPLREDYI